jgi:CRISPR type IV-associated protein Csf3
MKPLIVTARLEAGLAHAGPWGTALDGLLAAQLHAQAKDVALDDPDTADPVPMMSQASPAEIELPLARCELAGNDWHWAATSAYPIDGHGLMPDVRHASARADARDLEALAVDMPTHLRERNGRFRARWMPTLVTVCTAVQWRCVGDEAAVRSLLSGVAAIGKRRTSGQGRVLAWQVAADSGDEWSAGHLHPNGWLGRPTPATCLAARPESASSVIDGGVGRAGLRPPYVHPARQRDLHLPATP